MDRQAELERLIHLYQKQYNYSRLNAIKAIRSDLLDCQRLEEKASTAERR